jgi:outer membrane biosynthesis protein TonB
MMSDDAYYGSLNEMEKIVFDIAKDHMGTSFHVRKSNGYAGGGGKMLIVPDTTPDTTPEPTPDTTPEPTPDTTPEPTPDPKMVKKRILVKRSTLQKKTKAAVGV